MPISRLTPSYTLTEDRLAQLKEVVPEAFADGKINWEVLREVLGEHLEDEEQPTERFGLFWPGKREARRAAAMPPQGALLPAPGEGINEESTRNVFIEGENLEVLKLLRKAYAGRVKMIYIDPPYNTGNDFVYADDYAEPVEAYLQRTGQSGEKGELLTTNPRSSGRFHSNWLNMLYPRLVMARELLRDDGVLFVSIDDHELHNLVQVMNEVFGEECFAACITRATGTPTGGGNQAIVNEIDYVLVYFATPETPIRGLALTEKDAKIYDKEDERGRYLIRPLRRTGGEDRREDRPSMFYPIQAPDGQQVFPYGPTGYESRWICGPGRYKQLEGDGLIEWSQVTTDGKTTWQVYQKFYLEGRLKQPSNLWTDIEGNKKATRDLRRLFGDDKVFSFPKPVALVRKMIQVCHGDPDQVVFDFFAGSGTTGHAVMAQNSDDGVRRHYVLVQLPEPLDLNNKDQKAAAEFCDQLGKARTLAEVAKERLRRAGSQVREERPMFTGDLGFQVYKLGRSQLRRWQPRPSESVQDLQARFAQFESSLVEGWDREALRVDVMLQEGFPLDSHVERLAEVEGNAVDRISSEWCEHRLFVCLDSELSEETIERLPRLMGDQDILVCLDNALTDEAKMRLDDRCNVHVI